MPFFRRIFSSKILPSWTIFLLDAIIVAVSVIFAYFVRFPISEVVKMGTTPWLAVLLVTGVNLLFFRLFRTYSNILRLSSFVDVMHIFVATTLAFLCCVILTALWKPVFGTRLTYIAVLIISDNPDVIGKVMMGVNVYANDGEIPERIQRDPVTALIVSPAKAKTLKNSDLADRMLREGVKIFLAPEVSDDWDPTTQKQVVKEVQIEDLLGRDPIKINMQEIAPHLEGKRVLITGAAGSIGSEIMRQVAMFNPYQLILIDSAETPLHDLRLEIKNRWSELEAKTLVANVTNKPRMESIFAEFRPEYVFHAAAYKHVPMMEDNVSEAIQNNVLGTRVLADLAVKYKVARFVMVSTDKAVNPSNVMGCSKRICEIYVQALARKIEKDGSAPTQFITTRFGNVLGSNGSVIPLFRKQIAAGGPVTVTHPEIIRYFMTIPEACQLVLEAGSMGKSGEIYIFDMGQPVKIADLAKRMIQLSGRTDVKIEYTGLRHGEKLYEEITRTWPTTSMPSSSAAISSTRWPRWQR